MANTVFAGLGKFFFQFGLVMFAGSLIYILILGAYGVPTPKPLIMASSIFPVVGAFSTVMGVFGVGMNMVRTLFPRTAQLAGTAVYLSLFLPATTGVVTLLSSLLTMLPLPPAITVALASASIPLVSASIAYYLGVKMGYLPPE